MKFEYIFTEKLTIIPVHQFRVAMPSIIFVHTDCLASTLRAAAVVGFHSNRIVVIHPIGLSPPTGVRSLEDLIQEGQTLPGFTEKTLTRGEAKTMIAFLAPSSGTTGIQKVRIVISIFCSAAHKYF
jgi:hypothetical protein